MPLEAPNLDTRKFEEIFREARLRIPRYTPEWTDFNDSDPGITLLQLFSWLTESMLYQMNRVPERNYIKFLQLLGLELRPAQPASAYLTVSVSAKAKPVGAVNPGAQFMGANPDGGDPLVFEATNGLSLVQSPLSKVQVYDGSGFTDVTEVNVTQETSFRPFGWVPQVGSALYLGFDPAVADRPFPNEITLRVFQPSASLAGKAARCDEVAAAPAPPVKLIWEYRPGGTAKWKRLNLFLDESLAFTREGFLRIQGPKDAGPSQEGKIADLLLWLRCRLAEGNYPSGRAPEIDFIRPNVLPVLNVATVREEVVISPNGTASSGEPNQLFQLARRPVAFGSLELIVDSENGEPELWTRIDDFLCSGPDDAHYTLNHNTGEIRFGDSQHGRIPPAGKDITARIYRYGGGDAGNLGAGTISVALTTIQGVEKVVNERPGVGGAGEQKIEDLKTQAPRMLRSRNRAVTAEDFATMAQQSGGVARAVALPLFHPSHMGVDVPGAITVVVVPDSEDVPPRPSADLIQSVCRHLNQFRLLTSEVYVSSPAFHSVRIEATVAIPPSAAADTVVQAVKDAVNAYLNPLGPWKFGQELVPSNLYAVIGRLADVSGVTRLSLFVDNVPTALDKPVVLRRNELFYGEGHVIETEPDLDQN